MTFNKFLNLNRISKKEFSKISGIPLRQVFRYANREADPNMINALKIKVYTEGKVDLEDWIHEDEEPRPSLQSLRTKFDSNLR